MSGHLALLSGSGDESCGSQLLVASPDLVLSSLTGCLDLLGDHQHRFLVLLEILLVCLELVGFVLLDHLDACMLQCLADQDLQNWLSLESEVKETLLDVVELDALVVSFFIGNVLGSWLK